MSEKPYRDGRESDADLVYAALLRAEAKAERVEKLAINNPDMSTETATAATAMHRAIKMIREEIGNGLAKEGR